MNEQKESSQPFAELSISDRVTRIARILTPFYIAGLVISAPFLLGLFAYGLAHAADGPIVGLLAAIAGVFLVEAVPPLILLVKGGGPLLVVFKAIGGAVMLAGFGGMIKLLHFWLLEPQWMKLRFRQAMNAVEVVSVETRPFELHGRTIGLSVVREFELKRDLPKDKYGFAAFEAIKHVYVAPVNPPREALPSFEEQLYSKLLTLDGRPVGTDLNELARAPTGPELQAGRYRVEHVVLLWGLRGRESVEQLCRDEEMIARTAALHEQAANYPLEVRSLARLTLGSRRGYPTYALQAMPISYRYEHSSWMRGLEQLPIETCQQRDARANEAQLKAQQLEKEQWYEAGDGRLGHEDNPLFKEMCANDLDAVSARLARGTPKFNISGAIHECTIDAVRTEMFALAMPALYAREQEREGYCNVLRSIHERRSLPHLEKVAALRLPLLCTFDEQPQHDYMERSCKDDVAPHRCLARSFRGPDAWRAGLLPTDDKGQRQVNFDPSSRGDTVAWLQFLQAQRIPICATRPDGTNLLQEVVERFPADVVRFVVGAGCDAHVRPPFDPRSERAELSDASAAVHWFLRRNGVSMYFEQYAPLDPTQGRIVADAMGALTVDEVNYANPRSGKSLLHYAAGVLPERPNEWRYLLARGARVNVADQAGVSWFSKGYTQRFGRDHTNDERQQQLLAMLDELSVAQLRELIAPRNSLTGAAGLPIEEFDFEPGQLTMYLCRRKAKDCSL
jgi:hypothetical protein